jgi:hypothetical protein
MRSWIMTVTMTTETATVAISIKDGTDMSKVVVDHGANHPTIFAAYSGGSITGSSVAVEEVWPASDIENPKHLVTLRRDGDDYVVAFCPENVVAFRHDEPEPLRRMCGFPRWKIISNGAAADEGTLAVFKSPSEAGRQ